LNGRVPAFATRADGDALRALLDAAGYRETRLRDMLGADAQSLRPPDAAMLRRRTAADPAAGVLVRLLAAGSDLTRAELSAALGEAGVAVLERVGVIEVGEAGEFGEAGKAGEARVRASVRLVPAVTGWLASDRLDRHRTGAADFVTGPSPVSRHLAALVVSRPVDSALDLGCGCGILALGIAGHARRVVAADLNPRAVAMTRFNAALNGLDHVQAVEGDLFAAAGGERFDLVVSNPPFVLSPRPTFLYRDGGASLSRRIVREAPDRLAEGGWLQMLCNWPQRAGQDWRAELESWFEDIDCDAWVLRENSLDALSYAGVWLGQQYPEGIPDAVLAEWLDYLAREGIDSVGGGLIVMRRVTGRAPWREFRDMPALAPPVGESVARTVEARDRLLRMATDENILQARLRPSPDLEYHATQRPSGEGWDVVEPRLTLAAGLRFAIHADPVAMAIIGRLDGRRSLREAAADFAAEHGMPFEFFLPQMPKAFREMIWLGLVLPVAV
jgi:SAM-dependent methyltransferase